jgi:hypothetical protein
VPDLVGPTLGVDVGVGAVDPVEDNHSMLWIPASISINFGFLKFECWRACWRKSYSSCLLALLADVFYFAG